MADSFQFFFVTKYFEFSQNSTLDWDCTTLTFMYNIDLRTLDIYSHNKHEININKKFLSFKRETWVDFNGLFCVYKVSLVRF